MQRLAEAFRRYKKLRGCSYAFLATTTYAGRGWLPNIANGTRVPTDDRWVRLADEALQAGGELVRAWEADHAELTRRRDITRLVDTSVHSAQNLVALAERLEDDDRDELHGRVADLATSYFWTAPRPVLEDTVAVQHELEHRLRNLRGRSPGRRDLLVAAARSSGVLAYATLDLGDPDAALQHTEAAWALATRAENDELLAWVRGTQSLIYRFKADYQAAQDCALDGLRYGNNNNGSGRLRLLAAAAQCAANFGNAERALELLAQMERERPQVATDHIEGILGFSRAKGTYYHASSLMWIPDDKVLRQATRHAHDAVELWDDAPRGQRSHKDAALTRIYGATSYVRIGDLDGAMALIAPVLELPDDRRISWLRKRVRELAQLLDAPRYAASAAGAEARTRLLVWDEADGVRT